MSFSTYANLTTAIANWLHRSDLTSYVDDFVTIAEARINREVRSRLQETRAQTTITATYESVPSDFIEMRALWVYGNPIYKLEYLVPDAFFQRYQDASSTSIPKHFTIIGSELRFGPIATSGTIVELWYYKRLAALSSAIHALYTNYPDLYLYASLAASAPFLKNDARIAVWEALYKQAKDHVNETERAGRYGDSLRMVAG